MAQSLKRNPNLINLEFTIRSKVSIRQTGENFGRLVRFKTEAKNFRADILGKLNTGALSSSDVPLAMKFLASVDKLPRRTGALETIIENNLVASARNFGLPKDQLSIAIHTSSHQAVWADLEFDSLFGYRVANIPSWQWLDTIKLVAPQLSGAIITDNALKLLNELLAMGYGPGYADVLAYQADINGIKYDRLSGQLFLDLMRNTLGGYGKSLADGANPLTDNNSQAVTSQFWLQSISLSYSFRPVDWLSVEIGGNYYRGGRATNNDRLLRYTKERAVKYLEHTFANSISLSQLEHAFGLSFAVGFYPPQEILQDLVIEICGENLNSPTISRKSLPVRLGTSIEWFIFSREIPLKLRYEQDWLRNESFVVPDYHTQWTRIYLSLEPKTDTFTVIARIGCVKNVGDSDEPFLASLDLGVQLWYLTVSAGVESSFDLMKYPNPSLPTRFSGWVQLKLSVPIGR